MSDWTRPARPESAVGWELRGAWASRREIVATLRADRPRIRGYVEHVAATDAFALIWDGAGMAHAPIERVLSIRSPHFSEPADGEPVAPPARRRAIVTQPPEQLELDLLAALSPGQLFGCGQQAPRR